VFFVYEKRYTYLLTYLLTLITYLLENNRISKQQHGFLALHSTCSQLLECVNVWTIELNFRHSIDVAHIDFQKAFDSVVHSKLCHKLKFYGGSGKLLNLLTDFPFNCIQAVRINYKTTDCIPWQSRVVFHGAACLVHFFFCYLLMILLTSMALASLLNYLQTMLKCTATINDVNDSVLLQEGLDTLNAWSDLRQLPV